MELLAVVTLIGIFASVAVMRYGREIFGDFGSQAESRKISLALLHAQRASITTGKNHYLQFDAAAATTYSIFRRADAGDTLVDGPVELGTDVVVSITGDTSMEFNFEGQALAPYEIALAGENRSWRLEVIPINGSVRVTETTP